MKNTWKCCYSYNEAKNYSRIIYLHKWNVKPFYWGKANNSFFGRHKRKRDNLHASGRYNSGYQHWIDGCLCNGGVLYIGKLENIALEQIDRWEQKLHNLFYGQEMNTKERTSKIFVNRACWR